MPQLKLTDFNEYVSKYVKDLIKKEDKLPAIDPEKLRRRSQYLDNQVTVRLQDINTITNISGPVIGPIPTGTNAVADKILSLDGFDPSRKIVFKHQAAYPLPDQTTLVLDPFDIKVIAFYLSNKSNYYQLANDIGTFANVRIDSKVGTLCVQKIDDERVELLYSPMFIGKCIFEDYIKHYCGDPGFTNYTGGTMTLSYLIGHEMFHYRYNHLSKDNFKALFAGSIGLNTNAYLSRASKLTLDKIPAGVLKTLKMLTTIKQEKMCNSTMSGILGMPAANNGVPGNTYSLKVASDGITYNPSDKSYKVRFAMEENNYLFCGTGYWDREDICIFPTSYRIPTYGELLQAARLAISVYHSPDTLKKNLDPPKQQAPQSPKRYPIYQVGNLVRLKKDGGKFGMVVQATVPDPETGLQQLEVRPLTAKEVKELNTVLKKIKPDVPKELIKTKKKDEED
jgi:hypothetical protein